MSWNEAQSFELSLMISSHRGPLSMKNFGLMYVYDDKHSVMSKRNKIHKVDSLLSYIYVMIGLEYSDFSTNIKG